MAQVIDDRFRPLPQPRWRRPLVNQGQLVVHEEGLRLVLPRAARSSYSNAQLDDYSGLPRRLFPWYPPLRLSVRARGTPTLQGTAGFGFWNHPFVPTGGLPLPPRAFWFLHLSPPNNLPLAEGVPGYGWKAATIDALRPAALRWAPLAPLLMLLNRWPALKRRIWPRLQHDLQVDEALLAASIAEWHDYELEWWPDRARFRVDGQVVLETRRSPRGPLGFVAWVDNQYAIATPAGQLGFGLVEASQPQWLDLARLRIEAL